MARRSSRRGAKIQPAVKTLIFGLSAGTKFIDLSQVNSLMNRRFYRQGLNWAVASLEVQAIPDPGQNFATATVTISKVPDTWVASNAWEKGMRHWMIMNNEALEGAESVRPKFLDFKVFADEDHHALGVDANLMPITISGAPPVKGEWEMSSYQIPRGSATPGAASDREIVWTGASYPGAGASGKDAVSLIEGYAASRGLPDILDPNTPSDADDATGTQPENWISALGSEGTDQDENVLEDMISENNQAPYPFENSEVDGVVFTDTFYPGGANQAPGLQIHDELLITATTVGGSDTAPGSNFPGGLIRFDSTVENGSLRVIIRLVPGPVRGYMTQPMQDV